MDHEELDISNPAVCTKYTTAAEVVNRTLKDVVAMCVDGAKIIDICVFGDNQLETEFGKLYNKKGTDGEFPLKGIAYPVCITVNELCGAFSPVPWEAADAAKTLKSGDLVKIDIGGHIDGYPVIAGHSFVIGTSEVQGRVAELLECIKTLNEVIHRLVRPGNKSTQVTKAIEQVCTVYGVTPVKGIYSHEMQQHILDGPNAFPAVNTPGDRCEEFEFKLNQVFGIDVAVSTGTGKLKLSECKTTVYKRDLSQQFGLRTQTARAFIHELQKKCPTMAFSMRHFEEKMVRIGVAQACQHELLEMFTVNTEAAGEYVAQTKMTLAILPSGTKKFGGLAFTENNTSAGAKDLPEEIKAILALPLTNKKKKATA
eukprot:GDKJ01028392.1.p1 GENE.GDKJ01028392.1~~GDKJ01028392.1.p1  ORF type:complete len:378 (-),score=112.29 GDKJ01028392.1:73-1179(-)